MPFIATNYPENWKDEIRPRILKRDGYRCRVCMVGQRWYGYRDNKGQFIRTESREPVFGMSTNSKIIRIWLSVAHLDHDTWNNEDSNLKSMCQQCHNRHDRHHRSANRIGREKPKKNSILSNNSLRSNTAPNHRNTRKLKHTWLPPSNPPHATLTPCKRASPLAPNPAFQPPRFARVKVLFAPLNTAVIAFLRLVIKVGGGSAIEVVRASQNLRAAIALSFGLPPGPHKYQRPPGRELYRGLSRIYLFILAHLPHWLSLTPSAARDIRAALASGRVDEKVFYKLLSQAMGRGIKRPDGIGDIALLLLWCVRGFTCRSRTDPCAPATSSRSFFPIALRTFICCPFHTPAPLFGQSRVLLVM